MLPKSLPLSYGLIVILSHCKCTKLTRGDVENEKDDFWILQCLYKGQIIVLLAWDIGDQNQEPGSREMSGKVNFKSMSNLDCGHGFTALKV